jgi:phenol hydroxylase P3 protein
VPFMSGAAYNGDLPTTTFGFSAQSDESRHMTLGLQVIKFLLEQDEANVPIVQRWLDKWFWRGYRLNSLVAAMMDYMLPKKVMSWKEAFELYFEQQMLDGLFPDLARYGIKPPMGVEQAIKEKEKISHETYWALYNFGFAAAFNTWIPTNSELDWMTEKYPTTFDRYYRPRYEKAQKIVDENGRFFMLGLPQLCQVCQIPMIFTEPDDPGKICFRSSTYKAEKYHFCSDGCKQIFDWEPEKYVQSWLPVHEIYKGNCGGPSVPEVLDWYGIQPGDNGEYQGSVDQLNWASWHKDFAPV